MIVDITGTTYHYDHNLAKALTAHPEVVFRTAPYLADRAAFRDSCLRRDLLRSAAWLVDRWPGVIQHNFLWKAIQLQGYLSGWASVWNDMRRYRIPILHLQWCKLPLLDAALMRRVQGHGMRVVYTVHNALPHESRGERVRRAYRRLYRQADALIVLSRSVGQQVLDRVDDSISHKIHVIEHGVLELACPLPDRQVARGELNFEPDAEVVLFIGRISEHKGIADLIDAFEIARRDRPKLRLLIAGKAQQSFEPYRARIERLGITGITQAYPRFVSEQFKATLYAAADVAVMPHRESSQSGMALEALAAAKPIIATRAGGLAELVDEDVNGYSVSAADPKALARALTRFFSLPRAVQNAMATAGQALGRERFDWPTIARRHVDLYRHLCSARPAAFRYGPQTRFPLTKGTTT
jgi:glycosyltransferase involved in cell wall biosynthesis